MNKNCRREDNILIIIAFIALLCLVLGWILYSLFGHQLITAMYEGRSIGILNKVIVGQFIEPLEYYLERGDYLFLRINTFLIIYCITFIFFLVFSLRKRYLIMLLLSFLILSIGSTVFFLDRSGTEDAYVSYRYARNLSQGHGLVFNPGERVEGYSNFLYVLMMSLFSLLTPGRSIYSFSCILNIFFIILASFIFYRYLKGRLGDAKAAWGTFLFALCPSIWIWVASGLETVLVVLLQLAIWITAEYSLDEEKSVNILLLCFSMILSILTRADGFIFPVIVILYFLLKGRRRLVLYCSISVIATTVIYILWRYNYYGYPFPNSYYLKVSHTFMVRLASGIEQLSKIAVQQGLFVPLIVLLFSLIKALKNIIQKRLPFFQEVQLAHIFIVSWLLYWLYVGGDYLNERMLLILFPLGIFIFLKLLDQTLSMRAVFLIALVGILQASPLYYPLNPDRRFEQLLFKRYDYFIELGKFLKKEYPGKTIAAYAVGKVAYFSELKMVDMMGATDVFIAHQKPRSKIFSPGHNKFDPDYVFSRKPDVIIALISEDMHMTILPSLEECERKGYFLRYLFNHTEIPLKNNIIDISKSDKMKISQLVREGYALGIFEKK